MPPAIPVIAHPDRMLSTILAIACPDWILLVEHVDLVLTQDHTLLLAIVLHADMVLQTLAVANFDRRIAC